MGRQGKPPKERKETRTISIEPALAAQVELVAAQEGHGNFSKVVVLAVREFLARLRPEEEAA